MKKLGIIGGAGPLASALLYETLVKECYLQKLPFPEIVLFNYPFTRGLTCDEGKNHQRKIEEELLRAVDFLQKNGVEVAMLACNTLHAYLKSPSLPFFSLPLATLQEAHFQGKERLLILGTENTRRHQLYEGGLYPDKEGQHLVNAIIDRVLEGNVCQEDALHLSDYISHFSIPLDGVILGCTDLPVLHHTYPLSCPFPIYDSIKIPAKNILRGLL